MTGSTADSPACRPAKARLTHALVLLYPRVWRDRYGDELLDLLRCRPLSIGGVLATLRGAFEAHARLAELAPNWAARVRWAVITIFAAWTAFCVAAAGVAKTTEDPSFAQAAHSHPALEILRILASAAFAVAALAIAYAGLPLAVAATRQAYRRRDHVGLVLLTVPITVAAAALGSGVLLGRLNPGPVPRPALTALAAGWLTLVLISAAASVRAVAAVLHRTEVPPRLFAHASWAAVVAAGAMSAGLLTGAGYGLAVRIEVPTLFASRNGLLATPLIGTWLPALFCAAAAVLVADRTAWRALQAARAAR